MGEGCPGGLVTAACTKQGTLMRDCMPAHKPDVLALQVAGAAACSACCSAVHAPALPEVKEAEVPGLAHWSCGSGFHDCICVSVALAGLQLHVTQPYHQLALLGV